MKKIKRIVVCLVAVLVAGQYCAAQRPFDQVTAEIRTQAEGFLNSTKAPGLSVAVGLNDRILFEEGFGFADLENSVPATEKTVYRTASIAKPITATAVMQLVEQGKIDLDATIQTYCPTFPQKRWPITVRQILCHASGIRHYKSRPESSGTKEYFSIEQTFELFQDDPLLFEPGSKFSYSTFAYSLLGRAVETASGMPFRQYLKERVFAPAGMQQSDIDNFRLIIPHRTRGYARVDLATLQQMPVSLQAQFKLGDIFHASLHDTSMKIPGGGIVSTPGDLVRLAFAVQDGTLLKPETLGEMWTIQSTSDGQPTTYSLGWGAGKIGELDVYHHSGGQAGTSTFLQILPAQQCAVAVMCNLQGAPCQRLARSIAQVVVPALQTADGD